MHHTLSKAKNLTKIPAKNGSDGFTIVELMMATTVFSLVLLVALTAFLQIGRIFYKGVTITQTQSVAQDLVGELASSMRVATNIGGTAPSTLPAPADSYTYYCIGNKRYTYNPGRRYDASAGQDYKPQGNFGVVRNTLPGDSPCAQPCVSTVVAGPGLCGANSWPIDTSSPVELLASNMRLLELNISKPYAASNPKLYAIKVKISSGGDGEIEYTSPLDTSSARCQGGLINQQFCAVYELKTSVYQGIGT